MNQDDKQFFAYFLGRLFIYVILGATCFVIGYIAAEARFKSEISSCPELRKPALPKTKAQMKAFSSYYLARDGK